MIEVDFYTLGDNVSTLRVTDTATIEYAGPRPHIAENILDERPSILDVQAATDPVAWARLLPAFVRGTYLVAVISTDTSPPETETLEDRVTRFRRGRGLAAAPA